MRRVLVSIFAIAFVSLNAFADEWDSYGRDPGGTRYSPLTQITPATVNKLRVAWTFHTGDLSDGSNGLNRSGFETTPLLIDGRLYLTTPFNRVIALDPTAGRQLWSGDFRGELAPQTGTPYAMVRDVLKAPSGLPCAPPPWGELISVDLARGQVAWRRPIGTFEELSPGIGKSASGSLVLGGGPIVTAGGVIFVGGTMDRTFRAFAADSGRELWSAGLPASAHALPITYEVGGKQFVVIAAGGSPHLDEEHIDDALVAFALP